MNDIWHVVHAERTALIDDLRALTASQWSTPSLCPGWDVHDILAHLVDDAKTTRLGFVRDLLAAGFHFDRLNAQGVERERAEDPARTLERFETVCSRTTSAPVPRASRLVEAFVHGEDIRRPLGVRHDYPAAHVATALRYQVSTSVKMGGGKERAQGLRLVATDTDLTMGTGEEVRGTTIALLLAVSGRPAGPEDLAGPGAVAFS
ncbi:maleylpyruvate isomerase family mycothiol-dependent enzyme [Georgenia yuyongxinii]|uniref:Maleylpyruvate isomerase family mycothiol-dependent enzyme n=1 Tax=Georgenia yuyongxinii TaxID=2589797 RepID=A0A5B8C6Q7_9MICO|nr:maleylpyruvate isomerase family mycothiol-dependent enzyme [Georgenia yuyongxinii]QDC25091.1 maleylpyruvate isomerase family mycothiol-dependent enzyme [Georgenia yuyongxinii]